MFPGAPAGITVDPFDGEWVADYLLAGRDDQECLRIGGPVTRRDLRRRVAARATDLRAAGLRAGGTVALRMPPGILYAESLLAAWTVGAQVALLDHRLTQHEVDRALARIAPQLLVSMPDGAPVVAPYPGQPARTPHALLQLSSGSTGPSKVIGRTTASLVSEVERYRLVDGVPEPGERIVLLASTVHVLGLVGGLLYGLHTGAAVVVPSFLSTDAVLDAVASGPEPATVLGVPFHIEFLAAADRSRHLPQLKRMTVGGELVRPTVREAFAARWPVPLGNMYGMTEAGVIATDLFGSHRPALAPAPGMALRAEGGEILLAAADSPYVGLRDPARWADGWLRTRDAGDVDPDTGLVTIRGRLDSQVSVGGLKVDLTEVEQALATLPGVVEVVVAWDGAVEAFVVHDAGPAALPGLKQALAERLAGYKRPRRLTLVPKLPRTATGKLVRSVPALRAATTAPPEGSPDRLKGGAADVR
ncbi:class I adenylate-forming enzyme family protein [Phytohabitans suffuscus]|uniref:Long-chain-fatty-acid--CoA ligase n=1 Tax=Phytohabitans suffuscus TaxID=624315 RepID=A0A6F8YSJ2_9ACTN|nr:fatty acid--CoA ligase family protein [Phytohabitans suffuscus]BCB89145.1 long-chain-fatty-acid--CoA ligase [Phytohabitans suffuscus]